MPVPSARLVVAVAASSILVLVSPWPRTTLLVVGAVLLVGFVVDWVAAVAPSRVPVERELPGVVPLGGTAEVVWRVSNPGGRRLRLRLADELAPSLHPASRRARLSVPPHGRVSARTTLNPQRRGLFTPTEIVLRVDGPLGLAARQGRLRVPGRLRVYPPFKSREEAELRIDKARILEIGLRSAPGRGGGTEFDALREYTVDDEFRRVDWAATARTGKPIVRTYRPERNQTILLLLDSGRMMAGQVAGVPRLDHAMDAVMMLTAVASRLGDRVGMVAFDQRGAGGRAAGLGAQPARPGHRGHVRAGAGTGRERLPRRLRLDPRTLPPAVPARALHRAGRAGGDRDRRAGAAAPQPPPPGHGGERHRP